MYFVYFLMWIIFNGKITWEIAIFGLVIATLIYSFTCAFLHFSIKKDIFFIRKSLLLVQYVLVLIWMILKANAVVIRMILSPHYQNKPIIINYKTDLQTKTARVLLANSITLTPGTITVSLEENEYTIYCMDKSMANDIDDSVFVKLLRNMEKGSKEI